jgi:hypothetical protein
LEARRIWTRKIFRREVAAAMCCGEGEEPSLPSL